jgi:hypothetical protein
VAVGSVVGGAVVGGSVGAVAVGGTVAGGVGVAGTWGFGVAVGFWVDVRCVGGSNASRSMPRSAVFM